jgi:hypothetical protein
MANLPPMNKDIYENGTLVMITHTIPPKEIERWVKTVAELSKQPVDWHYVGGRACIACLGDAAKVREAIKQLLPEHDALQEKEYRRNMPDNHPYHPQYSLYEENTVNTAHQFIQARAKGEIE